MKNDYTKADLCRAAGLTSPATSYYISTGKLKDKKIYTQQELDDFVKMIQSNATRKTKKTKPAEKMIQSNATRKTSYSRVDLIKLVDLTPQKLSYYIYQGVFPNKKEYTEQDAENLIALIQKTISRKKPKLHLNEKQAAYKKLTVKPLNTAKSKAFDPAYNPFDIIEGIDPNAEKNAWIEKLMIKMKILKANSIDYINVPANIFITKNKTNSIITEAKSILSKDPDLKDAAWQIKNINNSLNVYVGSQIKRIN